MKLKLWLGAAATKMTPPKAEKQILSWTHDFWL